MLYTDGHGDVPEIVNGGCILDLGLNSQQFRGDRGTLLRVVDGQIGRHILLGILHIVGHPLAVNVTLVVGVAANTEMVGIVGVAVVIGKQANVALVVGSVEVGDVVLEGIVAVLVDGIHILFVQHDRIAVGALEALLRAVVVDRQRTVFNGQAGRPIAVGIVVSHGLDDPAQGFHGRVVVGDLTVGGKILIVEHHAVGDFNGGLGLGGGLGLRLGFRLSNLGGRLSGGFLGFGLGGNLGLSGSLGGHGGGICRGLLGSITRITGEQESGQQSDQKQQNRQLFHGNISFQTTDHPFRRRMSHNPAPRMDRRAGRARMDLQPLPWPLWLSLSAGSTPSGVVPTGDVTPPLSVVSSSV